MKLLTTMSFFIVLFFAAGCKHKQTAIIPKQDPLALQELLARLSDLPDVPYGYQVKKIEKDQRNPDSVFIEYQANKKDCVQHEDIKKMYYSSMELLGWNFVSEFQGQEILLFFERPRGKKCIISLRQDGYLIVFVLSKKGDLS
ncbi:MAG TPA: hypothetical protein VLG50_06985 [Candidatus Saccharimonadales bacterium]|nr:hypothetical protein [Candidatus Saccharimonadales bacterium]